MEAVPEKTGITAIDSVSSQASSASINKDAIVIDASLADDTLKFMEEHDPETRELTPEEEKKFGWKIVLRILSITFFVNLILYMDKATLSLGAIQGLFEHTKLTQDTYNDANTLFYVGFFLGQFPSIWLLQKVPLNYLLVGICVLWGSLVLLMDAAYNVPGVIILRFFLGFVESPALNILTTTNSMFMTRNERATIQPIFYVACMASPIPIGFIAYGTLFANVSFGQYRILNIIIGGISLLTAVFLWFFYPANPAKARFLSTEEKVWVIRRVQRTQHNTIQQKTFKRAHALEAIKDPISWLIAFFFILEQLANNLPYQQNILFESIVSANTSKTQAALDSTLISIAGAGFSVVWAAFASAVLWYFPNTSCFTVIWSLLPCLAGSIVAVSLPWSNTIGILAGICLASQCFGVAFIITMSLATSTAGASYTKRLIRNAMVLCGYCIGNLISPQVWQSKDAPRFVPAWCVQIILSFTIAPSLVGIIWFILARRNRERRKEALNNVGFVTDEEGVRHTVNVAALDMTDLEDRTFIYPL